MIANGMMGNGRTDIERSEMVNFLKDLEKSNEVSQVTLNMPKRKGFQKSYSFCDGQQKFKGMPKWNSARVY